MTDRLLLYGCGYEPTADEYDAIVRAAASAGDTTEALVYFLDDFVARYPQAIDGYVIPLLAGLFGKAEACRLLAAAEDRLRSGRNPYARR